MKEKSILSIITRIAMVLALICMTAACGGEDTSSAGRNLYDPGSVVQIKNGWEVCTDLKRNLAFQYSPELEVKSASDGIYVYTNAGDEMPYILVTRVDGNTDPEKYFKQYQKKLTSDYPDAASSDIEAATVGGKSIYRQRSEAITDNGKLYLNHYLEMYKGYNIAYTTASYTKGDLDGYLSDIISTLYPSESAYNGVSSAATAGTSGGKDTTASGSSAQQGGTPASPAAKEQEYTLSGAACSILLPAGLDCACTDYMAAGSGDDLICFAGWSNTDARGAAIYNAAEFAKDAADIDGYLADFLGWNSIRLTGGSDANINGVGCRRYNASVTYGDFTGNGVFCAVDSPSIGCYIMLYAVRDGAQKQWAEQGESFLQSLRIQGTPGSSVYQAADLSELIGCKILYKEENVSSPFYNETGEYYLPDPTGTGYVSVSRLVGFTCEDIYNTYVNNIGQLNRNNADFTGSVGSLYTYSGGRYDFTAFDMQTADSNGTFNYTLCMYACGSGVYSLYYVGVDSLTEWKNKMLSDLAWSLEISGAPTSQTGSGSGTGSGGTSTGGSGTGTGSGGTSTGGTGSGTASRFDVELYDNGDFYMYIPKGWRVSIVNYYEAGYPTFQVQDPKNPDRSLIIWVGDYAGYVSETSKNNWIMIQQNAFGYHFDYALCPVIADGTAKSLLSQWEESRAFRSSGSAQGELAKYTNFNVYESNITEDMYTEYGQTWNFDVCSSEAYATCNGPSGSACKAYMHSVTTYMNAGGSFYDTNYYRSGICYTILAPTDYFDDNISSLQYCATSLGFH